MKLASTFAAASILAVASAAADAADGRTGPVVFTGSALDTAIAELNGFVQARYAVDEAMGYIHNALVVPQPVPVYVKGAPVGFGPAITHGSSLDANLVSLSRDMARPPLVRIIQTEMTATRSKSGTFGPAISGDVSFKANLAALHDDMRQSLPVFQMIADLGHTERAAGPFGPYVSSGAALDAHLAVLNTHRDGQFPIFAMIADVARGPAEAGPFGPAISGDGTLDANLVALAKDISEHASDAPYVTGASFDAYAATLTLY